MSTKEKLRMEQLMDGVGRAGQMAQVMWVHSTTIAKLEQECTPSQMEVCMKESGVKI